MIIRTYLRASTDEQDAGRARELLESFAASHGQRVATEYVENASGATLDRPALQLLLQQARHGDVLLVESIDRLSRLPLAEWDGLRATITGKGLRIVAVDLPLTHQAMRDPVKGDEFSARMLDVISGMMVDMMAAIARKDYEQRRERQAQGIEKAKAAGLYKGRAQDSELRANIRELLAGGFGVRATARLAKCSATTVMRVRDEQAQQVTQ